MSTRIVHNRLLGGWFVVRGAHQTPLGGPHASREAAKAWLAGRRGPTQDDLDAAARGLRMAGMPAGELGELVANTNTSLFAGKAVAAAARQLLQARARMGHAEAREVLRGLRR